MRLLEINSVSNKGSTGRIAEGIGRLAISNEWNCVVAYGRDSNPGSVTSFQIGGPNSVACHVALTRLLDMHGLGSFVSTMRFLRWVDKFHPDIIHLHNIHGYYLNYPLLFKYICSRNIPVVWTLHDCWSFTGHCCYFDSVRCEKWKTGCHGRCPLIQSYPKSFIINRAACSYRLKKRNFILPEKMCIVPVSFWLDRFLGDSFLSCKEHRVIHNGIPLDIFKNSILKNPETLSSSDLLRKTDGKPIVLGVASTWDERKGLTDFVKLNDLTNDYQIVLVGLSKKQIEGLPGGIIGIERTENQTQLAHLYQAATVFFNPTYSDNYPTTNLEASACGTPVVTYRTGGSPESVYEQNGYVVEQGDLKSALDAFNKVHKRGKQYWSSRCRAVAEQHFNEEKCFMSYLKLYDELLE